MSLAMDASIALNHVVVAVALLWMPTPLMNVTPHLTASTAALIIISDLGIVLNIVSNRMSSSWQMPTTSVLGVPEENSLIGLGQVVRLLLMPPLCPLGLIPVFPVPRYYPLVLASLLPLLCSLSVTSFLH